MGKENFLPWDPFLKFFLYWSNCFSIPLYDILRHFFLCKKRAGNSNTYIFYLLAPAVAIVSSSLHKNNGHGGTLPRNSKSEDDLLSRNNIITKQCNLEGCSNTVFKEVPIRHYLIYLPTYITCHKRLKVHIFFLLLHKTFWPQALLRGPKSYYIVWISVQPFYSFLFICLEAYHI